MSEVQNFVKEALLFNSILDRTAERLRTGSFSERNPTLGKMQTCKLCRIRERSHQCTAKIRKGTEVEGVAPHPKRKNPRLTRNRPPLLHVHQLLVEIEAGKHPELENVPEKHMARYIEKKIKDWRREAAHVNRDTQKLSRRINWGLA